MLSVTLVDRAPNEVVAMGLVALVGSSSQEGELVMAMDICATLAGLDRVGGVVSSEPRMEGWSRDSERVPYGCQLSSCWA